MRREIEGEQKTGRILVDPARSNVVAMQRAALGAADTYGLVGTTTLPEMMAALAASIFLMYGAMAFLLVVE
jgi:hypothetical protein